jgi:hypothetical protein
LTKATIFYFSRHLTYLSAVNFGKRFLLFPSAQTVRAAFTRLTGSAGKTDFGTLSER